MSRRLAALLAALAAPPALAGDNLLTTNFFEGAALPLADGTFQAPALPGR